MATIRQSDSKSGAETPSLTPSASTISAEIEFTKNRAVDEFEASPDFISAASTEAPNRSQRSKTALRRMAALAAGPLVSATHD